jgi:hypothetical protein
VSNEYGNPEYAPIIAQLKDELQGLREKYEVVDIPQTVRAGKKKKKTDSGK